MTEKTFYDTFVKEAFPPPDFIMKVQDSFQKGLPDVLVWTHNGPVVALELKVIRSPKRPRTPYHIRTSVEQRRILSRLQLSSHKAFILAAKDGHWYLLSPNTPSTVPQTEFLSYVLCRGKLDTPDTLRHRIQET